MVENKDSGKQETVDDTSPVASNVVVIAMGNSGLVIPPDLVRCDYKIKGLRDRLYNYK